MFRRLLTLTIILVMGGMMLALGVGGLWRCVSYFSVSMRPCLEVTGKVVDDAPPEKRCRRIEYEDAPGKTRRVSACGLSERPGDSIRLLVPEDGGDAVIDDAPGALLAGLAGAFAFYISYAFVRSERRKGTKFW